MEQGPESPFSIDPLTWIHLREIVLTSIFHVRNVTKKRQRSEQNSPAQLTNVIIETYSNFFPKVFNK